MKSDFDLLHGNFITDEYTHPLRLESKLSDLRTEHAHSFVHTHEWIRIKHVDKKRTDNHKGCPVWRYSPRAKISALASGE